MAAGWRARLARNPHDDDVVSLYALRLGLCDMVATRQIEPQRGSNLCSRKHIFLVSVHVFHPLIFQYSRGDFQHFLLFDRIHSSSGEKAHSPSRLTASSLILYFSIFPAAFIGKLSTNSI